MIAGQRFHIEPPLEGESRHIAWNMKILGFGIVPFGSGPFGLKHQTGRTPTGKRDGLAIPITGDVTANGSVIAGSIERSSR